MYPMSAAFLFLVVSIDRRIVSPGLCCGGMTEMFRGREYAEAFFRMPGTGMGIV